MEREQIIFNSANCKDFQKWNYLRAVDPQTSHFPSRVLLLLPVPLSWQQCSPEGQEGQPELQAIFFELREGSWPMLGTLWETFPESQCLRVWAHFARVPRLCNDGTYLWDLTSWHRWKSQARLMILTNESTEQVDGSTNFLVISFYFSTFLSVCFSFYLSYAGVNSLYYQDVIVLVLPVDHLVWKGKWYLANGSLLWYGHLELWEH